MRRWSLDGFRRGLRRGDQRGVTLSELMVAVVVLTVGVLGGMAAFQYIAKGISTARTKTIVSNLAQEKMEVLKNLSYAELLVTTATATNANYTPNLVYDAANYPSETISLYGYPIMTRSVFIAYANVTGNSVSTVSYTSNDTGLKEAVVYVTWQKDNTYYKMEVRNLVANPNAASLDSSISGNVKISGTATNLASAFVQVLGSPQWQAFTDVNGNYSFQVAHGTYSLVCSSAGYFTQTAGPITVYSGTPATAPTVNLVQIASGTVSGDVWIASNVVISEVVASSGSSSIEFVELFNPTTYSITIGGASPPITLYVGVGNGAGNGNPITLTYNNVSVPAASYYLIASTSPITVSGITYTADAIYAAGPSDQIQSGRSGGVALVRTSDGAYIDRVGWAKSGGAENAPANFVETSAIVGGPNGLADGDELVRMSGHGSLSSGYGRSYDTDNNAYNFFYFSSPMPYGHDNTSVSMPVVAGRPAYGAYVTSNDGNSTSVQAAVLNPGTYQYANFVLPGVSTGTWTVVVTSGAYSQTVTGVAVTQGATTNIPNAATTPVWPTAGSNELLLTSSTSGGYAQGYVYGAGGQYNTPLSSILVTAGGPTTRTSSNGYFLLAVSTGSVTVTANFNSDNVNYTIDSEVGTVGLGQAVFIPPSPYIHLSQGGTVTGYVTGGTGALPNVIVQAALGAASYTATSDSTGHFYVAVATNASAYTVSANLDPAQTYTTAPSPLTATVTSPGSTVFAGTITVTGALGTISGTVSLSGGAITTGVLVVASQTSVPDPPPTITAASAPGLSNPYYAVTSQADGTYNLNARAGSSYYLRAYYPVVDVNTGAATYTSKALSGITVTAGQTTGGQNFTWP